jgi:hypothetical protein
MYQVRGSEVSSCTKAAQIAAVISSVPFGKFKTVVQVNKKKVLVFAWFPPASIYFIAGEQTARISLGPCHTHVIRLATSEQLPLIESVQAHKNPGDNFMVTSNPIHAGHGTMIETCSIARVVSIVYLYRIGVGEVC